MTPPWLIAILKDIKASRVYRELPAELRDRIEDGLRAPQQSATAPTVLEQPTPTVTVPSPATACPLCGGAGCGRCKPPPARLKSPTVLPHRETLLEALEREAPEDLAVGRRLLLTKNGLSATRLAKETKLFFAQKPRFDRIVQVFKSEIVSTGRGRYCFKHVDRSKDAPDNQGPQGNGVVR